jgi:hypothetical protein
MTAGRRDSTLPWLPSLFTGTPLKPAAGAADTSAVVLRPAPRRLTVSLRDGLLPTTLATVLLGLTCAAPPPCAAAPGPSVTVAVTRGAPVRHTVAAAGSGGPAAEAGSGVPGAYEGQPSEAEVEAAAEAAAAAHALVTQRTDQLVAARAALGRAAATAGLALERYRSAVLVLQRAQLAAARAQDRLEHSDEALRTRQEELGGWVREAYGTGGVLARSPAMATLLSGAALDDLDLTTVVLGRTGTAARQALTRVVQARVAQQAAADAADAAQQAATTATVAAGKAREDADTAVRAQQAAVDQLQADLTDSQDASDAAQARAARLAGARALADAHARAWRNRVTGEVGSCAGGDPSGYANGTIPLQALCPLWGAPGEYLRADASYAFGRLSQAYAAVFGTPICVTDSYRSYPEQVRIYAEKPELAAVPGTSNHGWATAADLCGGVESFGTVTHGWMRQNAPGFGWFHPSWAEPGGSRPEAWHWEFAG